VSLPLFLALSAFLCSDVPFQLLAIFPINVFLDLTILRVLQLLAVFLAFFMVNFSLDLAILEVFYLLAMLLIFFEETFYLALTTLVVDLQLAIHFAVDTISGNFDLAILKVRQIATMPVPCYIILVCLDLATLIVGQLLAMRLAVFPMPVAFDFTILMERPLEDFFAFFVASIFRRLIDHPINCPQFNISLNPLYFAASFSICLHTDADVGFVVFESALKACSVIVLQSAVDQEIFFELTFLNLAIFIGDGAVTASFVLLENPNELVSARVLNHSALIVLQAIFELANVDLSVGDSLPFSVSFPVLNGACVHPLSAGEICHSKFRL